MLLFLYLVRPTEITESDVFICESIYDEMKKQIRKNHQGSLRKFTHSQLVTPDEIFHFKRNITVVKVFIFDFFIIKSQFS